MKHSIRSLTLLGLSVCCLPSFGGEVLRHMSDELAPAVSEPVKPAENDRRIIYRVICTPGGEVLPDCEQPVHDTESVIKPALQQDPDYPVAEEQVREVEKTVQPAKTKKSKKTAGKKKTAAKKAKKTASKKKAATKKK
ncbi:hypothetical protein [Methylomonas methanica]|uniref:Uncharacterized protein n=1 Tax=Methylomonas methanica (strain DSM 25384 / MC09) TaxID=857087 RepID=G0A3F8_METMM|nr:hypothetical protein [Methylomonas methanica]AEG00257.1 hypothetical protein Metme_1841 [Methylomonas methanica MC09]